MAFYGGDEPKRYNMKFMLPVNRATYLKQVGMAAALNQLQLWIGMSVAIVLWQQLVASQAAPFMMDALIYSFLCQIGLFGLAVWLIRLRKPSLILLVGMVLIQLVVCPMMFIMTPGPWASCRHVVLWAAAGFAAFGLLAARDAYRRWLVTDLD